MASKKEKPRQQAPRKTTAASSSTTGLISGKWLAVALASFAILLYINTLGHDYVLDDFSVIKENFITKRGLEGIPDLWRYHSRHGYWNSPGELYRPITMTLFALEWAVAPDQPWLGHLINILLYGLTAVLLFFTLTKVLSNYNPLFPLLATLFFVAHPIHTEVVANIKSRDEIVMFLLAFLSINLLWRHLENGNLKWLLLSLVSFTVALFSKENAVTFIGIIPLTMYFFGKSDFKKIAATTAMYLVPTLIFIAVRSAVIGDMLNPGQVSILDNFLVGAENSSVRLANAFRVLGIYLFNLFFPVTLCSDFGFNQIPLTTWGDWRVLLSLVAWLAIGVFGLIRLKNKDLWSFAILFFLINFSIFSNIVLIIGTSYGDRLLYAASPGFAMALSLGLMKLFKAEVKPKAVGMIRLSDLFQNKGLWATAGLILLLYSVKTFTRNADWFDSYTLYEADTEVSPNAAKLNFHYGLEIVQRGLAATDPAVKKQYLDRSKKQFEKAIQIYPSYHDAYGQLGLAFYREKNYEKALENYNLALKYKPNFPLVYSNMGIIFFEKGDLPKAKACYEKAVQYDPRMVDALRNLGAVNAMEKNFEGAIKWFSQAHQYAPEDATINFYLGSAYKDAGRAAEGQPYLDKAYRLDPALKK
jgi:tetratricopeptide (TPR) repeat protein